MRTIFVVPFLSAVLGVAGCEPNGSATVPGSAAFKPVAAVVEPPAFKWLNFQPPDPTAKPIVTHAKYAAKYRPQYHSYGPVSDVSRPLDESEWGEPGAISLMAFPEERVAHVYEVAGDPWVAVTGIAVRVVNRSNRVATIPTVEGRFRITQEALTHGNVWEPLEYSAISCGFGAFEETKLKANCYSEVSAPSYEGSMRTRLRFSMLVGYEAIVPGQRRAIFVYSNSFAGSINAGQLEPKDFYKPKPIEE